MKYFTPELLARFGSENDDVASAAEAELERRSEGYATYLQTIRSAMPPRFRELQDKFYLHDARVVGPLFPWLESGQWQSFKIALHLDTPPKEFLVLHYRPRKVIEVSRHESEDASTFLEWQYDEVEMMDVNGAQEFEHSILFTNGLELRLRFSEFDFATLMPTETVGDFAPQVSIRPAS